MGYHIWWQFSGWGTLVTWGFSSSMIGLVSCVRFRSVWVSAVPFLWMWWWMHVILGNTSVPRRILPSILYQHVFMRKISSSLTFGVQSVFYYQISFLVYLLCQETVAYSYSLFIPGALSLLCSWYFLHGYLVY